MIFVFAKTDLLEEAKQVLKLEEGLELLVNITDQEAHFQEAHLMLTPHHVEVLLNWGQGMPPYLVTKHLPYNPQNLLGLIFMQLGAYEKAAYYLQDYQQIMEDLMIAEQIQQGNISSLQKHATAEVNKLADFDHYRRLHNQAVLLHYGGQQDLSMEFVVKLYGEALAAAPDDEYYAYTTKQLSDLYLDTGYLEQAEEMLRQAWHRKLRDQAHFSIQSSLVQVLIRKLQAPYPKILLAEITVLLKECLSYYKNSGQNLELGFLNMDAAWVAQLNDNFSEGVACINQAIRLFEQEELPEMLGDALIRKGTLLYTWAQKGQPFHQQAIDSYQKALKIFSRDVAPYVYADIHHHLALIYSEMPANKEKKAMLYAIASKSFQEALAYFEKEHFPYEYGCVCNNYGNALLKFPDSNFQNTSRKAITYFEEALSVRRGDQYPQERATSLLNLLEAYWQLPLDSQNREVNQRRWNDMKDLAREARALLQDHDSVLKEQAELHLSELEKALNSYA